MASHIGPKIDTKNLVYTMQPGVQTRHMTYAGTTAHNGTGVTAPSSKAVYGPRDPDDRARLTSTDPNDVPIQILQNTANSLYDYDPSIGNTYSISLWVKVNNFPTHLKIGGTVSFHGKRSSLARLNYSMVVSPIGTTGNISDGYIEFGAMAPYYRDTFNVDTPYKLSFEPISFGVVIAVPTFSTSIYTDYKFLLNTWYLLTVEISSTVALSTVPMNVTQKLFVNGVQETTASYRGIPWFDRNTTHVSKIRPMSRPTGKVAGQPGFYNVNDGSSQSTAASWTSYFSNWINLKNLNHVSYSPVSIFKNNASAIVLYTNNNMATNPPSKSGLRWHTQCTNTGVDVGQLFIHSKSFDSAIYTNFKYLYT